MFGPSHAKVSAVFTDAGGLVAAFDLVYCSLSVTLFVFVVVVKWLYVCVQQVYCKVEVYVR